MVFKSTLYLNSKNKGGRSENFSVYYNPPMELDYTKQYEIGLANCYLWYSWYNISEAIGNNIFRYYNKTAWASITIPNGSYNISDLNDVVKSLIDINEGTADEEDEKLKASRNITIKANYNTLKAEIRLRGGYRVDFAGDSGKIRLLLGFDEGKISKKGINSGQNPVNITDVNTVYIHCSLVNSAYENSNTSGVIYAFSPNVPPGYQIQIQPYSINWMPIGNINSISKIQMRVTNQDGVQVDLNNEVVTYSLRIREV